MEIPVINKDSFRNLMLNECGSGNNTPISLAKHPKYLNIMSAILQYKDTANQILKGVIIIGEYGNVIHDMLVYVDGELYIQNTISYKWYADTSTLLGLRNYLALENVGWMSLQEVRAIIGICTKFGFIDEMLEDDFKIRVITDELCK